MLKFIAEKWLKKAAITVYGFPPGCYIAEVTTTGNAISTGKFLVNNK